MGSSESGRIIHLNVKCISTNYFPNFCVEVCDNDTIRICKHKIFLMTCIPESMFSLVFSGRVLEDNETVLNSNLNDGSTIYIIYLLGNSFNSKINFLGKTFIFRIKYCDFIKDLKFMLQDTTGFELERIKLFLDESELKDNQAILDCMIHPKSNLIAKLI